MKFKLNVTKESISLEIEQEGLVLYYYDKEQTIPLIINDENAKVAPSLNYHFLFHEIRRLIYELQKSKN